MIGQSMRPRPGRRGVTLIEMLVMLTIVAAILGGSATLIQLLMRLDRNGRARLGESVARERLARQLRQDVHDARSAEPFDEKGAAGLRIQGGTAETIEYRAGHDEVVRIATTKGKPVARERYDNPREATFRFETRIESSRRFVAMVVTPKQVVPDAPSTRVEEVVALVGKDRLDRTVTDGGAKP